LPLPPPLGTEWQLPSFVQYSSESQSHETHLSFLHLPPEPQEQKSPFPTPAQLLCESQLPWTSSFDESHATAPTLAMQAARMMRRTWTKRRAGAYSESRAARSAAQKGHRRSSVRTWQRHVPQIASGRFMDSPPANLLR